MMLDVTVSVCANHRPGRDTGSWLDIGHETNTISCYPRGKERQHRTEQQNNLGGRRYRCCPVLYSCATVRLRKNCQIPRPGLSYGHRRSASAPRRALVVLRTPMDPAPCPARVEKKTAKVTITATGQLCCTQQLVGDPGVPVATSLFLVLSRRDSCERAIIGLGLSVSVSESRGLLDLASPSGSSGTVFLPPLVPSILSEHNRSRLLAVSDLHVESDHFLLSSWDHRSFLQVDLTIKVVGSPPCHYVGLVPLVLFPEFADMEM